MGKAKRQGYKNARDQRERRSHRIGFWGLIGTLLGLGYEIIAPDPSPWIGGEIFGLVFVLVLFAGWERSKSKILTKIVVTLILAVVFVAGIYCWIERITVPSFVFVKPAVWLNNNTWLMLVEHSGPRSVYNIEILFSDQDRLLSFRANPTDLSLLADRNLKFDESDPKGATSPHSFLWQPLNADHQHYFVSISSRDKRASETLNIERVGGDWKYAMKLKDDSNKILLFCRDVDFPVSDEWPKFLTPCFPDFKTK